MGVLGPRRAESWASGPTPRTDVPSAPALVGWLKVFPALGAEPAMVASFEVSGQSSRAIKVRFPRVRLARARASHSGRIRIRAALTHGGPL